ncbi:MAG: hypothetical protein ACYTG4_12200, partial [Planctomycetota bacterium]
MSRRMALWFPWLLFTLVFGWMVVDQWHGRAHLDMPESLLSTENLCLVPDELEDNRWTPGVDANIQGAGAPSPIVAVDPVCGLRVSTASAWSASVAGAARWFCTVDCRAAFVVQPEAFDGRREAGTHTMRGIPVEMFQWSVVIVLLMSFGLFEFIAWRRERRPGAVAMESAVEGVRWNLTGHPMVRRAIKWPPLRFIFQGITATAFLLIIFAGLFGNQNPAMNIAPITTWTIWWAGLILLILFAGKIWCYACPWDAIATWVERFKFWGPRTGGLGLGEKWPRRLRNIWLAVGLFVVLTWVELGMGITLIPRATAWIALGMLALATASVLLFDRKAFCRYGCLVGRVSGLYSLFSTTELRVRDDNTCADCKTMDCYRGNEKADGCPTFEFPRTMTKSTYCILCTQCIQTCPKDNIDIRLRPWGTDLVTPGKPRQDEAFLAVILLSMTGFHGLTMTPSWAAYSAEFQAWSGLPSTAAFAVLMSAIMVAPILLFWGLAGVSSLWARPHRTNTLFMHYAYSLLPIALFYHLAHNAEHFLMEGPKVVALMSDPFGWNWNLFGTALWKV